MMEKKTGKIYCTNKKRKYKKKERKENGERKPEEFRTYVRSYATHNLYTLIWLDGW